MQTEGDMKTNCEYCAVYDQDLEQEMLQYCHSDRPVTRSTFIFYADLAVSLDGQAFGISLHY